MFAGIGSPIPPQDVTEVSTHWPAGNVDVRMANYLCQAQQKWQIGAVPDAGGYPGSPYFKITVAGTGRTLAATADAELVVLPAFTGAPEQLWRKIEQFPDGACASGPNRRPVPNKRSLSRPWAAASLHWPSWMPEREAALADQNAMRINRKAIAAIRAVAAVARRRLRLRSR